MSESPRRTRRTRTQSETISSAVDNHFVSVALRLGDHCNSRSRTPSGERRSLSPNAVSAFQLMDGRGSHANHQGDTVHVVAQGNYVNSELAVQEVESNRFQNARSTDFSSAVTGRNCSPDCRQGGEFANRCPRHGNNVPPPPPPKKNKPRISIKPKLPKTVSGCHGNQDASICSASALSNAESPAEVNLRSQSHEEQLHGTPSHLDDVITPDNDAVLHSSPVSCVLTSDNGQLPNGGSGALVQHNSSSDEDWVSATGGSSHSNTDCAGGLQPEHTTSVEMRLQPGLPGPASRTQSADVETEGQRDSGSEHVLASCGAQLVVTSKAVDLRSSSLVVGSSLPLVCSAAAPGHRSLSPAPDDGGGGGGTVALAGTCAVQSVSNNVARMMAAEESVQHPQPMIAVAPVALSSSVHSVEDASIVSNLTPGEEHEMTGEKLEEVKAKSQVKGNWNVVVFHVCKISKCLQKVCCTSENYNLILSNYQIDLQQVVFLPSLQ